MKIEIKNRWNGQIIFEGDFLSLKLAVEHCVKASVNLRAADLRAAYLRDANLSYADLSDAPFAVPNIDAQILARIETDGKLNMNNWHTCETTHCRAGWAIELAGSAGKTLEFIYGSEAAGNLIYAASRKGMKQPNFRASNEEALSDIKACAAKDPMP